MKALLSNRIAAITKAEHPSSRRRRRFPLASWLASLLLGVAALHAEPPPATPATPATPANASQPGPGPQRQPPKAEWVETNHGAPNGTQYQTFASKVLGHDVSYLVYLPPGYDQETTNGQTSPVPQSASSGAGLNQKPETRAEALSRTRGTQGAMGANQKPGIPRRYPVIYWLHGMNGNQRGGAMMFVPHVVDAVQQGILSPVIVVLVNGMVKSFYCDSADGQMPMESVIIKDLIPHIDQTYRTVASREGRIIEGYSMGGFGAAHLGFKYPELFGTVVINAGALIEPTLPLMAQVFGDDIQRAAAEHPMQLARQNADKLRGQTHIRIGCGSVDNLLSKNKALHELLDELHIPHEFEIVPDIAHDSVHYYQKLGAKVFEFHQKSLAGP